MQFDPDHLRALAAVLRCGSFEKAARQLGVTQSAVSQRIKQLEERVGAVLIVRGQPCMATPAGARLCQHAEEVALLEKQVLDDLGLAEVGAEAGPMVTLKLAVNADSLATWFLPAMAAIPGLLFDLVLDDQDHSTEWLRRGEVRAAVTSVAEPVQGCDCQPLGLLVYRATASPDFAAQWFGEGVNAGTLAVAPCLTFNAKDGLQTAWIEAVTGRRLSPPSHWLPSSQAFIDAARLGLGWGMNPEIAVAQLIAEGALVDLIPEHPLAVPLYWHWTRSLGRALDPLTKSVLAAAQRSLPPIR